MPFATRRWHAVQDTPLATFADALINRGEIYGKLLDLGLTAATGDRRTTFVACGFDTDNKWYWLDMKVDRSVAGAWLNGTNQRRVRELLGAPLLFFKPTGELIRVWYPTRRQRASPTA